MARQVVCLGFGYVAAALGRRLGDSARIIGTNRDGRPAPGAEICPFDGPWTERVAFALARADAVLISAPPGDDGCPAFAAFEGAIGANAWVGYLSTTGVYGDRGGDWCFETDAIAPQSERARRRAVAEAQWQPTGAHIFRLPGIYGPGRSAFDRLRAGEARRIDKPGLVHSRAHVDDIAAALAASLERPNPGRIYNVADDWPTPPHEVVEEAARMIGVSPPPLLPYDPAAIAPQGIRFYEESRRVSNARLKAELDWRPTYPSFREGLEAIAAGRT